MKKTMSERMKDGWTDGLIRVGQPVKQSASQKNKILQFSPFVDYISKYKAQLVLIDCSLAALKKFIDRTGY